jgi:hypothetical protein
MWVVLKAHLLVLNKSLLLVIGLMWNEKRHEPQFMSRPCNTQISAGHWLEMNFAGTTPYFDSLNSLTYYKFRFLQRTLK